jgi:hypothetical protein
VATADSPPAEPARFAGTYRITFEEVNTCRNTGIHLGTSTVVVEQSGRNVTVTIPGIPIMRGTASKAGKAGRSGKFQAVAKRGKTAIEGLEGSFQSAGTVTGAKLDLMLIAEYFAKGKALCTQSWRGTGIQE